VKLSFFILSILFCGVTAYGQKYTLEKSMVVFFSDGAIEDIKAENIKTSGLLNISTGDVVYTIPVKDFEFEKSLMKEHFNEKYLESEKFPKAIFQGKFLNLNKEAVGEQVVNVSGKLTIHGVTKEISQTGTIEFKSNQIIARSKFVISLEDYHIKIPQLLWQNIAEQVEVTVEFIYKPL
jgi:polyisoprenoid-binding protein YceI